MNFAIPRLSLISKQLVRPAAAKYKSYFDIPGPKSYPIIGSFLNMKQFGGEFNLLEFRNFQHELQAKYGNIVRWEMLTEKNVYLYDPEHIKHVFKYDGSTPARSKIESLMKLHKKLGFKSTLLNSDGDRWKQLRSLSNPCMARPQTIQSYITNHNEVVDELVKLVDQRFQNINQNESLVIEKFDEIIRLLVLECISEIVFDERLNCINEKTRLPNVAEFVNSIVEFFVQIGRLMFSPPLWKIYPTEDWVIFEKAGRFVYKTAGEYIQNAQSNLTKSDKRTVLKDFLLRKEKYGLNLEDVVAIMTDFLIGGVDTTSASIYYLIYELGVNQNVQQKLYEEIKRVTKEETNITENHIENLKYLKCVVKESLRLHSTVPANGRISSQDIVIDNYLIPKGTNIVFCNSTITKSNEYFNDALKFDPDRWTRDENEIHPYSTLSFSFGARMCIGRRVAEQVMYLTLIKLIKNYRIEYIGPEPGIKCGLILSPDRNLTIKFHKR